MNHLSSFNTLRVHCSHMIKVAFLDFFLFFFFKYPVSCVFSCIRVNLLNETYFELMNVEFWVSFCELYMISEEKQMRYMFALNSWTKPIL